MTFDVANKLFFNLTINDVENIFVQHLIKFNANARMILYKSIQIWFPTKYIIYAILWREITT